MLDALEIGYAIKERRAELGLTQAQLAEAAGVSKRCLWSLELGESTGVRLDKLTAVLGALGLELSISASDSATSAEHEPDAPAQAAGRAGASDAAGAPPAIDALSILTGGAR